MADNDSITVVSKNDSENAAANPYIVQLSDGTAVLSSTTGALHVLLQNASVPVTDNGGSLTVDAVDLDIRNLSEATDQVLVFANTAADGTGTDLVPLVDAQGHLQIDVLTSPTPSEVAGTRVHDQQSDAAVAAAGSVNHDVTAVTNPLLVKRISCSASGAAKFQVEIGPAGTGVLTDVKFIPAEGGTVDFEFSPSISVTATEAVRVIKTNRNKSKAQDLYSTAMGDQT